MELETLIGLNNTNVIADFIDTIINLPEDSITGTNAEMLIGMINGAFTPVVRREAIDTTIKYFQDNQYTRVDAVEYANSIHESLAEYLKTLQLSVQKLSLVTKIFDLLLSFYDDAITEYYKTDITLKMMLEEGARVPTYAHETDAAADLYAANTVVVPAHSRSTMIRTGVHIQLPEGWMAIILPRSSMGMKTGLRLSNSAGVIDQGYLGQLGVIYDNIGDTDYIINAGDRIAQLLVMPCYQFKAEVVDTLESTDRGEGGFGSSGR